MSSLYEIIELPNGDIALPRADDGSDKGEPLVSISFSEESIHFLGDSRIDVARAMIEAGLDTVSELSELAMEETGIDLDNVLDELLDVDTQVVH